MKKKTLNKLKKALKKIEEATALLYDADDEIFYEDTQMLTRNMSIQDTIKEMYKSANDLKSDMVHTLNAIND